MDDQNPSPPSSSCTAVGKHHDHMRRRRRHVVVEEEEEEHGDSVACTGKSCQSCTAGVIADCVAVCCCPCAVVNLLALAFLKLPWAVARKCIGSRKRKKKQMILDKDGKCSVGDTDGISRKKRVSEGTSGIVVEEEARDNFSAGFEAGEILYEVGHLGFGRVSFTGIAWNN